MKKKFSFLLAVVFALFLVSCAKKPLLDEFGCYLDMDEARENAVKNDEDILVLVTASGDDYFSSDFLEDVVATEEFDKAVASFLTVYRYDFSESSFEKTVVKDTDSKKDQKVSERFAELMRTGYQFVTLLDVQYTPAFYLLTKEGYVISEIDYEDEITTAEEFAALLQSYNDKSETMHALVNATKTGTDLQKVNAIDALYQTTPEQYKPFLTELALTVPKLDEKNESGIIGQYIVLAAQERAVSLVTDGSVAEAVQELGRASENEFVDAEGKQSCYYTAAYFLAMGGSFDTNLILSYLSRAYDAAPDSDFAPMIQNTIEYFEGLGNEDEGDGEEFDSLSDFNILN